MLRSAVGSIQSRDQYLSHGDCSYWIEVGEFQTGRPVWLVTTNHERADEADLTHVEPMQDLEQIVFQVFVAGVAPIEADPTARHGWCMSTKTGLE